MKTTKTLCYGKDSVSLTLTLSIPDDKIKALSSDFPMPKPMLKHILDGVFNDLMPSPEYMLEIGSFLRHRVKATNRLLNELKASTAELEELEKAKKETELKKNKEVQPQ